MPYSIKKYLSGLSSLIFPALCKGCGEFLGNTNAALCRSCEMDLPRTHFEKIRGNPVEQLFWGRTKLEFATSLYFYRKGELLQSLIHQLKYKQGKSIGIYLGRLAGQMLLKEDIYKKFDLIVPVPLHPKKQKIRGYNQSAMIAEGIRSVTKIPVEHEAVIRTVHSESQTRRKRYERWLNVDGIFKVIYPESLRNKHLLVLDDVVTTGSTIEALYSALAKIPGVKVSVLSIGIATG